jgi:hypothetical protein
MKRYIMAFALLLSGIPLAAPSDGFMAVHDFKDKNGALLGQLQVRYLNRDIFDSLRIVKTTGGQEEFLYRIDKNRFFSRDALEQEVYDPGFYGYRITRFAADHVVLTYMRNKGKTTSDTITILWDGNSKAFHKRWQH